MEPGGYGDWNAASVKGSVGVGLELRATRAGAEAAETSWAERERRGARMLMGCIVSSAEEARRASRQASECEV